MSTRAARPTGSAAPRDRLRLSLDNRILPFAGVLVILAAGLWAYSPALRGEWIWDDHSEIVNNAVIKDPAGLPRIWSGSGTVDYFPLKTTLQWLQWRWWGDHPLPYHVTNLALHLLSALLFWWLLLRLGLRLGWVGGLLFALHPLAVESVAWIAEFKNAVSLPPLLGAVLAYLAFLHSRRPRDYAIAFGCFVVAALAKSSVVMLPPCLLLLAWWRTGRLERSRIVETLPFFAVSLVLGLVTVAFQHERAIAEWHIPGGGMAERFGRAAPIIWFYFAKSVLPVGLLPLYPRAVVTESAALQVLGWAAIAGLLAVGWHRRAHWGRHLVLGFGWFLLHLLPVTGVIRMAYFHFAWVADHFAYLPLLGVVGLATAGIEPGWRRAGLNARRGLAGAVAVGAGACLLLTRGHAALFRSEETLWRHTLRVHPEAWLAHNNLAATLVRQQKFTEALGHVNTALLLKPDYAGAHANAAVVFAGLGRLDEALAAVGTAERHQARSPEAHIAVASALLRAGRGPEAIGHYERALQIAPANPQAHKDFAVALFLAGRHVEAIRHYAVGLQAAPDAVTHTNFGVALVASGRAAEALVHYERALQLAPGSVDAHFNAGIALVKLQRMSEAAARFEAVVQAQPDHADAWYNLGEVLAALGRKPEAARAFEAVLKLQPGTSEARQQLEALQR